MADANKPIEQAWVSCDQVVYGRYGSRNSIELNVVKYDAEVRRCIDAYVRNFMGFPKVLSAMVGQGERRLGLVAWGSILIPSALLWIIAWSLARIPIAAGRGQ